MKRNIITIMMALAALLMAQCKKQTEQQSNEPAGATMEVRVRVENATSKTEITATGVASWKQGDKLYVVGESQGLLGYVSAKADGDPADFEGSITALTSAQTLRFYYVGDKSFTLDGSGNCTFDLGSQDGSLAGIADHNQLAFGKTTSTIAVGTIDFGAITMTSLMSIAHLNINDGGAAVSGPVAVTGGFATSTFNAKTYDGTTLTGTAGNITMTFASGTTSTNCYLALLPGTQTLKLTDAGGGKVAKLSEKAVAPNTFYNSGSAIEVAVTPKPIEFTVDANGTTVEFAPGNLYWDGTESKFKFEANQWDFRHYNGKINDAAVIGGVSGTTPSGTVGSFFWSKTASVAYAQGYSESGTLTSDVFFTNATQTTANPNFQVNGETAGTWRTLSKAEWDYLLGFDPEALEQTDDYGRHGAKNLCAWMELDGGTHKGLVILPDDTDASVMESITSTEALATYGAVFLPAAGYRSGAGVFNVGSYGDYWSSTPYEDDEDSAYFMGFESGIVGTYGDYRYYGRAVRLVSEN